MRTLQEARLNRRINKVPKDVQRIIGWYIWNDSMIDVHKEFDKYTCILYENLDDFFTYSTNCSDL